MVQLMETWFLADRQALANYFGTGFRISSLPARENIEEIPKHDIVRGLLNASKDSRKGEYHKGKHSFRLLETLDPSTLEAASPWAKRFFEYMRVTP